MARHAVSENRPLTRRQITSQQELASGVRAGKRSPRPAHRLQAKRRDGTQVISRGRVAPLVEAVRSYLDVNGEPPKPARGVPRLRYLPTWMTPARRAQG